jgi:hypothetical protein
MARFYSSFNNATVPEVEAWSAGRLTMGGSPTTLRNTLISTRLALSDAFKAQINPVNDDGTLGTVVPRDGFTRAGGVVSSSNLYRNNLALWQSDPRVRPSSLTAPNPTPITVGNSTAVSPADAWSISETLYTDASTAVMNTLTSIANIGSGTGGGPYSRLGADPYRTLASIYHDHALTYFAWDDFTPGQPGALAVNCSNTLVIITWPVAGSYEFPADALAGVNASFGGTFGSGGGNFYSGSVQLAPGSVQAQIPIGASFPNGTPFDITATVSFFYTSPVTVTGAERSLRVTGTVNNV